MNEIFDFAERRMQRAIDQLEEDYSLIKAGRANPAILNKLMIDYYDTPTPINQIAAISVTEARVLTVQPWDSSICQEVEKAIQKADLGVNPQTDGKVIRIVFPQLTEDRRREIVRDISKMAEDAKVSVRSARRDAIDKLKAQKKNSEITEDELKVAERDMQNLTDTYCKKVEEVQNQKSEEIMDISQSKRK